MPINGPALGAVAVGTVFVYSGIKGYSVLKTVQNVVQGTPGNTGQTATSLLSGGGSNTGGTTPGGGGNLPSPPSGNTSANMRLMQQLAAGRGWTGAEWSALYQLIMSESGFDNTIWNGGGHTATQPANSSGAYGIGQALPYSKMPKAAWPTGYGGSADARSQIEWTLGYIAGRYGDPIKAWAFHQANNWY
jgi:resuscitation-promoting factor RpfB